ncbi:MAG TPA: SagB/ThcOx family dehydrogenase, partial [Ktedonobacteraceae bacterium]|nr:SagB/ThcOx family dehydrogenase [Ktedonobacteraceae bacterium]
MRGAQTFAAQADISTTEAEISGPTEQYIQWLRTEFSAGRWAAEPFQPCLLYKVYQDTARIPLDGNIPLQLGKDRQATWERVPSVQQASPEQKLSWLLYYTHGLTRILRPNAGQATSLGEKSEEKVVSHSRHVVGPVAHYSPFLGRPVPSGGSLHPVEMYVALGAYWRLPAGIYHYDSVHHALDLLRTGNFMVEVAACLPMHCPSTSISATIFLANCIQKNHQKYTILSYLLQTLDTGIALQQLRFVAYRLGLSLTTHLSFIDAPLHSLLGLDSSEELIYVTLPLYADQSHSYSKARFNFDEGCLTVATRQPCHAGQSCHAERSEASVWP